MAFNNLCNSCTNIGCEVQSGIVRMKCAFYMPPHIEPDNCGNYVVMQPIVEDQYEARLKADMVAILDKIRAEIEEQKKERCFDDDDMFVYRTGLDDALYIIDKYKTDSDIEKRKPCINCEDGCEEWSGCPCVHYKAESEK